MANTIVSNSQDVIDSRDIIARIEELEADPESNTADEGSELVALKSLAEEGEGSPDWQYGETLIRDSHFKEYAQELAEDCGMLDKEDKWPYTCIDWDHAARELRYDYFSVDFDGVTYWVRG